MLFITNPENTNLIYKTIKIGLFGAPFEQDETISKGRNQVLNIKELINGK